VIVFVDRRFGAYVAPNLVDDYWLAQDAGVHGILLNSREWRLFADLYLIFRFGGLRNRQLSS
jgi:hypothetical protein